MDLEYLRGEDAVFHAAILREMSGCTRARCQAIRLRTGSVRLPAKVAEELFATVPIRTLVEIQ